MIKTLEKILGTGLLVVALNNSPVYAQPQTIQDTPAIQTSQRPANLEIYGPALAVACLGGAAAGAILALSVYRKKEE